jgi:hypothetical protein
MLRQCNEDVLLTAYFPIEINFFRGLFYGVVGIWCILYSVEWMTGFIDPYDLTYS